MRHVPSTAALRAFEAAGRLGSFLRAAEELNVTPGAVSRQIQGLEGFLGKTLFERGHKQVALTPIGRDYLREIQGPLKRIDDATGRIRADPRAPGISICAYPTFAIRWIIPRWGRLHDRYPKVDLRLHTSLDPADFEQGVHDLAFQVLTGDGPGRGLEAEPLMEVFTFPVCAPSLAARIGSPADLARHQLLHSAPRPHDWRQWLDAAGVTEVDPGTGQQFESTNLAWHAAIEGAGVAIGVEALIADDLRSGRLVRLFETRRRSNTPIALVYPKDRAGDALLRSVKDWFLEEARGAAGHPADT